MTLSRWAVTLVGMEGAGMASNEAPQIYRDLGARLRRLREARGLSQPEVGALVGLSASRISQVESGGGRTLVLFSRIVEAMGAQLRIEIDPTPTPGG